LKFKWDSNYEAFILCLVWKEVLSSCHGHRQRQGSCLSTAGSWGDKATKDADVSVSPVTSDVFTRRCHWKQFSRVVQGCYESDSLIHSLASAFSNWATWAGHLASLCFSFSIYKVTKEDKATYHVKNLEHAWCKVSAPKCFYRKLPLCRHHPGGSDKVKTTLTWCHKHCPSPRPLPSLP
jgi:hypothetical protein